MPPPEDGGTNENTTTTLPAEDLKDVWETPRELLMTPEGTPQILMTPTSRGRRHPPGRKMTPPGGQTPVILPLQELGDIPSAASMWRGMREVSKRDLELVPKGGVPGPHVGGKGCDGVWEHVFVLAPKLVGFGGRHLDSVRHPRQCHKAWKEQLYATSNEHSTIHTNEATRWRHAAAAHEDALDTPHETQRGIIRNSADFMSICERWWVRLSGCIDFPAAAATFILPRLGYAYVESRLYSELCGPSTLFVSVDAIGSDFMHDRDHELGVTYHRYCDSLFEVVDTWAGTTTVEEYVAVLADLYLRVFEEDPLHELDQEVVSLQKVVILTAAGQKKKIAEWESARVERFKNKTRQHQELVPSTMSGPTPPSRDGLPPPHPQSSSTSRARGIAGLSTGGFNTTATTTTTEGCCPPSAATFFPELNVDAKPVARPFENTATDDLSSTNNLLRRSSSTLRRGSLVAASRTTSPLTPSEARALRFKANTTFPTGDDDTVRCTARRKSNGQKKKPPPKRLRGAWRPPTFIRAGLPEVPQPIPPVAPKKLGGVGLVKRRGGSSVRVTPYAKV